ncbi:hypothetical protein DM01DRAFT_1372238 [Hesseltinella vesiculosa]|uniref:Arrestin C-terminal-like domain-containing protein n=1 Tax=Hesseltinella vesiculosa TaxID=101127 RepID=A0A1X2GNW0_9FUNG|nr:hypothetical protein DM01DRAFT_1372238 [Hesseltinella vesiculosa]
MSLKAGHHAFPFEILLSNTLSESVECGLGHVRYKLACQIHTQSSWHALLPRMSQIKAKQTVILVRLPSQDSPRCISQTHHIQDQHQLNLVIETAHVTPGAILPLSLHFSHPTAIASLQDVTVKLTERQKFRAPAKQTTRILHHEITLPQQQQSWSDQEARFIYQIPDTSSLQVHPTTSNRMIRVRHWIQVSLTLLLTNGDTKEIWMDAPIQVLQAPMDDYHTLPVYQSQDTSQPMPDPTALKKKKSRRCLITPPLCTPWICRSASSTSTLAHHQPTAPPSPPAPPSSPSSAFSPSSSRPVNKKKSPSMLPWIGRFTSPPLSNAPPSYEHPPAFSSPISCR